MNQHVNVRRSDAAELPFENHYFYKVTAIQTHIYWDQLEKGLMEVFRVLKLDGHFILVCEKDHALIVGDAFVTVKQEYLYKVLTQEQEISGPPRYLTTDWQAAKESVIKLEALKPTVAITGHGMPMSGDLLTTNLKKLVNEFDQIAVPDYGKYVDKNIH